MTERRVTFLRWLCRALVGAGVALATRAAPTPREEIPGFVEVASPWEPSPWELSTGPSIEPVVIVPVPPECVDRLIPDPWRVERVGGTLRPVRTQRHYPSHHELRVSDGLFIGIDRGEWGGELRFHPADGGPSRLVWDGPVSALVPRADDIIVLGGSYVGSVHTVTRWPVDGTWHVGARTSLDRGLMDWLLRSNGDLVILAGDNVWLLPAWSDKKTSGFPGRRRSPGSPRPGPTRVGSRGPPGRCRPGR